MVSFRCSNVLPADGALGPNQASSTEVSARRTRGVAAVASPELFRTPASTITIIPVPRRSCSRRSHRTSTTGRRRRDTKSSYRQSPTNQRRFEKYKKDKIYSERSKVQRIHQCILVLVLSAQCDQILAKFDLKHLFTLVVH